MRVADRVVKEKRESHILHSKRKKIAMERDNDKSVILFFAFDSLVYLSITRVGYSMKIIKGDHLPAFFLLAFNLFFFYWRNKIVGENYIDVVKR